MLFMEAIKMALEKMEKMEQRYNVITKTSKATNARLEANCLPTREYDIVARGITSEMVADWQSGKYIVVAVVTEAGR